MRKNCLEVKLLGKPELRWHERPLVGVPPRLQSLLFYLAVRGVPVARSEIEELLWGPKSSHNLRQAIYQLRVLPGADQWLRVAGHEVEVEATSDLGSFEQLLKEHLYGEALAVWPQMMEGRTALLWGFELEGALAFSDWLEVERARIELLYREALEHRALELEQAGAFLEALGLVQNLLRQDPLSEGAYQAAMRLCYHLERPEEAQFYMERCRRVLLEELGIYPSETTFALAHSSRGVNGVAEAPIEHPTLTLRQALERLPDPRSRHGQRYPLTPLMGLVLLAFLAGAHSLRDIVRFAQSHPEVLDFLEFPHPTPPGRSALSELFQHLDALALRQVLSKVGSLPHTARSPNNLETRNTFRLIESWAIELRYGLNIGESGWGIALLERLGWSAMLG
jgi:DNA-binding SARP family transcriptional activator